MNLILLIVLSTQISILRSQIIDANDGKQIASFIKDVEVQDKLEKTDQFQKCKKEFKPGISDSEKTNLITEAQKCFQEEINKGSKDLKQLEELSEKLGLQEYGIVKSKNVQEIQKYLNDKMYKSMTGVDPSEKDLQKFKESMKFGNKKNIDQAKFIEIYKAQIGKNVLFEISRFCFENLRKSNSQVANFAEHWDSYTAGSIQQSINSLDDTGNPSFGNITTSDKEQIYKDVFTSIQGSGSGLTPDMLKSFFVDCASVILPMCEKFEKSQSATTTKSHANSNKETGSSACLTKTRIHQYRKGLAQAEKISDEFKKMTNDENSLGLLMAGLSGEPIKFYGEGNDPKEDSIDDLTNYTARDIIEGGHASSALIDKKAQDCLNSPGSDECSGFITEDSESLEKAKHNIEIQLTLQKEIELEKIRKILNQNDQDLDKFLEEKGYFEILSKLKDGSLKQEDIPNLIAQSFEAKKAALIAEINSKVAKRQLPKNSQPDNSNVQAAVDETKSERSRMAQVVLFNNIITSHLEIKDGKDRNKVVGSNINVWKREEDSLKIAGVDENLFQNIKTTTSGSKGADKQEVIVDLSTIDELLGKK